MQACKKLLFILTPQERRRVILLLIMSIIMGLLDTIGIVSILPFITVLANQNLIETNFILSSMLKVSKIFGVENNQHFIYFLGALTFLTLIISLNFKAITTYAQVRFSRMSEYSISKRLVEGYLHQDYSWFLNRHGAALGGNLLLELNTIQNALQSYLELISRCIVVTMILTILIFIDIKITIITGLLFSLIYVIILKTVSGHTNRLGKELLKNNEYRFIKLSETFGSIKEIKVRGLERNYLNRFSNSSKINALNEISLAVIAQIPRFALEILAFGGILLIAIYLVDQEDKLKLVLPILSLYALAGYRLMPSIQQIYLCLVSIKYYTPLIDKIFREFKNLKPIQTNQSNDILTLNKSITLKNIHYNYPNSSIINLKDICLSIKAKSTVGLVGATGSGKTTLINTILGLLEPQKGILVVDGKIITKKNLRSWQRLIGYVPQNIYLSDDTVENNIAFGLEPKDICYDTVVKAAKIANLHQFIIDELPKKYKTAIGENGARLSGGQRQRIGIARALYHSPQVLVLDEATSALDNQTEKKVIDAIKYFKKDITIILITHRLGVVKNFDNIFLLSKGKLIKQGKFEEIKKL